MASTTLKDVRTKGEVIGQVSVTTFDSLDEAEEELGEETVLGYVNRQIVISALDNKRRELTGGASTGIRALMKKVKDDPALLARIKELVGEI